MWLMLSKNRFGVIKVTPCARYFDICGNLAGYLRRLEHPLRDVMREHDLKVLSAKVGLESA
jgi:hypothetical protein